MEKAQIDAVEDVLRGLVIITGDSTWDMNYVAKAVLAAAAEARGEDDRDPYARHPKAIADNVSEIERLRAERDELLHMNQQYVIEIDRLQTDLQFHYETKPTDRQIEAADMVDGFLNELEYQKQAAPNATATAALQWAYDEIVRLRRLTAAAEVETMKNNPRHAINWEAENEKKAKRIRILERAIIEDNKEIEAATIERCAQVAEKEPVYGNRQIAAALRALKDKP